MDNIATVLSSTISLPIGIIPVADTAGFTASGQIAFNTEDSTLVVVTYSAKTATAFTGATGGTGSFAPGTLVVQMASNDDLIKAKSRRYRGYRQSEIIQTSGTGSSGGSPNTPIGIIEYDNGSGVGVNVSPGTPLPVTGTLTPSTAFANNSSLLTYTGVVVNASASNSRTGVGYKLRGFTATGSGDGEWSMTLNGVEIAFGYNTMFKKVETVYFGNPISVIAADTVALVVTNRGDATTNYRAIILGE